MASWAAGQRETRAEGIENTQGALSSAQTPGSGQAREAITQTYSRKKRQRHAPFHKSQLSRLLMKPVQITDDVR